ncbi:MAG: LptF/LptG family permease [Bacteroidales bacterium]|jgi:lipopolysaccharide export system permease protein|nr:LptF/LptG family permease [Bacteroidales bacterium]
MIQIKRLYTYMLQKFLLLLVMTFVICLFILLMQFLWKYVDEMVGKGLDISVLGEFFVYASISLMPQAIPLAILLASLMTFGNLGEQLELLAIKAAGVSLLHVMRPLLVFILFISLSSIIFQNYITPKVQVKMYSLLLSIKQKSPELQIPVGSFYKQIAERSILVRDKDPETGLLKDIMIYDFSKGSDNASIILADSARLKITDDKLYIVLNLFNGEQFENLERQTMGAKNIPYRRESFLSKTVMIEFNSNFERMDDGFLQNEYVAKNLTQLQHTVDSMTTEVDSMKRYDALQLLFTENRIKPPKDTAWTNNPKRLLYDSYNPDSVYARISRNDQVNLLERALNRMKGTKAEYSMRIENMENEARVMRRHNIEWHKKFSLSFSCIIFFLIGAPLGAIIRKGGLGMPVVASVLLFIIYYIMDNIGYKMGKNGVWEVWQGTWLSAALLTPLGFFLTYKANRDSAILNADAYVILYKKIFAIHEKVRNISRKEISMKDPDYQMAHDELATMTDECASLMNETKKAPGYVAFWTNKAFVPLQELSDRLERIVDNLRDTQDNLIIHKIGDYPILSPEACNTPIANKGFGIFCMLFFPIGIPFYIRSILKRGKLFQQLNTIIRINRDLNEIILKHINI